MLLEETGMEQQAGGFLGLLFKQGCRSLPVTQQVGGAQSCPILYFSFPCQMGSRDGYHYKARCCVEKSFMLSHERECQKKTNLLLCLPGSNSLLRKQKGKRNPWH